VIDAYTQEVIFNERTRASVTRESLRTLHQQLRSELAEKMEQFESLSKELGSSGRAGTGAILSMLASEVRMIQQQIIQKESEMLDYEVMKELAIQQARSTSAMQEAIQEEMSRDPMFQSFQQEKYSVTQQMTQLKAITKRKNSPEIRRLQDHLRTLDQQIQEYRITKETEVRERERGKPNEYLAQVMREYTIRRSSADHDLVELRGQLEEKIRAVKEKDQTQGPLAILESEIAQLQEVERTMDLKIRSWDVQDKVGSDRVRVMQKATKQEKINAVERYTITALGALTTFCLVCYAVALVEFRSRRLNSPADVDEGLGIRVLGVLPTVSSRKSMLPGSPVAAQLSESIDGIRAILMHESTSHARQVVLITSPASLEGCTTVASHLALSLTRAGRRTLLIDGDLREPSLHKLFGMPVEGGMSEVLRSEIDVAEAIRPTNTEGLWLMTAGQCDLNAIHALATDQLQPIFEKIRAEFDYVVIDGAPLLSLSDSISIGQHVDGAILTLLRDHSEIRKVLQSAEMLKSMGIELFGAVVNGVHQKADRRVARLHHAAARPPRQLPAGVESSSAP
jgi:succinoglycan biosynthesis transport protein ExoP